MEYVNPLDTVEFEVDKALERAVDNPKPERFRSSEPEAYGFEPEDPLIDHAEVDLANRNVGVQFSSQLYKEKYVVVAKKPGFAIVESYAKSCGEVSGVYHVVTPELDLVYENAGYRESMNRLPRQAALRAFDLLQEAQRLEPEQPETSSPDPSTGSTVPPPEKDPLFD